MEFRHRGNGGDRRRRVLFDDSSSATTKSVTASRSKRGRVRGAGTYSNAAQADCEARLVDFIPTRTYTLLVLFLLGLVVIAALVTLHQHHTTWCRAFDSDCLAILNLAHHANLAAWVSSAGLSLAALTAVLVYRVRRHQVDDYRAAYRVWLWAAGFLLVASANATAGLHEGIQGVLSHFAGTTLWDDGYVWWVVVVAAMGLPLALVLLMDMHRCRAASLALIFAIVGYSSAAAMRLQFLVIETSPIYVEAISVAALMGHLALLMTLWIFARHVFLGAQGKLQVRSSRKKTRKKSAHNSSKPSSKPRSRSTQTARAKEKETPRRTDLDVDSTRPTTGTDDDTDQSEVAAHGKRLSKAERRRLRKQLRRQRNAA